MPTNKDIDKKYVLNIGTRGTFEPTYNFSTSEEDLDHLKDHILQSSIQRVAIYAHGGLLPILFLQSLHGNIYLLMRHLANFHL